MGCAAVAGEGRGLVRVTVVVRGGAHVCLGCVVRVCGEADAIAEAGRGKVAARKGSAVNG